jgi:hypothetical protein
VLLIPASNKQKIITNFPGVADTTNPNFTGINDTGNACITSVVTTSKASLEALKVRLSR